MTLIELLAVIVVLVILLANTLPTLGGVRQRAYALQNLSNLRQHATIFNVYLADWQDSYPAITDPRASYTIIRYQGRPIPTRYFSAKHIWPFALADHYYDGSASTDVFFPSGRKAGLAGANIPYEYSHTFLANSRYWDLTTREGPHQWGPVRAGEVDFPSRKGLLVDFDQTMVPDPINPGFYARDFTSPHAPVSTAFCDGSAADHKKSELSNPVPQGEGPWLSFNELGPTRFGLPVMHTFKGSRGTDR